jgi:radical SAM superfamily enzyme YgiQ (UPF0313 family)
MSKEQVDVLFVHPLGRSRDIYGAVLAGAGVFPPLGMSYLAAVLEKKGVNAKILDMDAVEMPLSGYRDFLETCDAKVIGVHSTTPTYNQTMSILSMSKESGAVTLVGGPHSSALPEHTARQPQVDFVVRSESELTVQELVPALLSNQTDFHNIQGITFKEGNEVASTPPRPFIEDLDSLPFPARHLLPVNNYRMWASHDQGKKTTSMVSSRGCPFGCVYCGKSTFGRTWRARSPKNVVDEMVHCNEEFGIEEIQFFDDTFSFNRERAVKICEEIKARGLDIDWHIFTRVDKVDEELLTMMKDAGLRSLAFGLESGDNEVLKNIRKGTTVEQGYAAVKMVKKLGIMLHPSFMIGNPGETPETIKKTVKMAKSLGVDYPSFSITTIYPGTELWKRGIEKGWVSEGQFAAHGTTKTGDAIFIPEGMTAEQLRREQQKAHRAVFFTPQYVIGRLRAIKSFHELRMHIKAAVGVIEDVLSNE